MGKEIERKFLVKNDAWRKGAAGIFIRQGYLSYGPPASVRVRIHGDAANVNIKISTRDHVVRDEFEYPIPAPDAEELLARCCEGHVVEKVRHKIKVGGFCWEVDEFHGPNAGLIIAEIELDDRDRRFPLPDWAGDEVSGDTRYLNTSLSRCPYAQWPNT